MKLVLDIDCGTDTCASSPGNFCKYVQTQRFGTRYFCKIFSEQGARGKFVSLYVIEEGEHKGWLARHPECVAHNQSKETKGE
jgi:hypothetical protein